MKKLFSILFIVLAASVHVTGQIVADKSTKKYIVTLPEDVETMSVSRAGSGELINRFYYWAMDEFSDYKHSIQRDDTLFRGLVVNVSQPILKKVFGVGYTHTDRILTYDLILDADKKDYTYTFTNFHYKSKQTSPDGEEAMIDVALEEFKGAEKRPLLNEIAEEANAIVEKLKVAGEVELSEEQEAESSEWRDTRKEARAAAQKAAAQAKKEAEAAAKKAAKEKAKAEREAAKEAAAKAREAAKGGGGQENE